MEKLNQAKDLFVFVRDQLTGYKQMCILTPKRMISFLTVTIVYYSK